jgi:hypothetical protein
MDICFIQEYGTPVKKLEQNWSHQYIPECTSFDANESKDPSQTHILKFEVL